MRRYIMAVILMTVSLMSMIVVVLVCVHRGEHASFPALAEYGFAFALPVLLLLMCF
jgi:hypothetical protein